MAVQTKKIKYYGGEFHEESDLRNKKDKRTEKQQTLSKKQQNCLKPHGSHYISGMNRLSRMERC